MWIIVSKIKASTILEKYLSKLIKEVELENPANAYDIQMASLKVAKEKMKSILTKAELNAIKDEAYSRGLLLKDIMPIFGVLLRDRILVQRGYSFSDVDKHTPTRQAR